MGIRKKKERDPRFDAERSAKWEANIAKGKKTHKNKYKNESNAGMKVDVHVNSDYTTEKFDPTKLTMPYGEYRAMQGQRTKERNEFLKQISYDAAAQARAEYAREKGREMWNMPNDLFNSYRTKLMNDSTEAANLHDSWYNAGRNNTYVDAVGGSKEHGFIERSNEYIRAMHRINNMLNAGEIQGPIEPIQGPAYAPEELFYDTMSTADGIAEMRTKQKIAAEMEAKNARRFSAPKKTFGIGDIANMRFMAPVAGITAYNLYNSSQAQAAPKEYYYDATDGWINDDDYYDPTDTYMN